MLPKREQKQYCIAYLQPKPKPTSYAPNKAQRKANDKLKKDAKAKDEAKFNVKALVVREEYQENLKV